MRPSIVLVEDNADIREPLQELLQSSGHHVEWGASGPDGVRVVLPAKPDVAIVDVGLPGFDGYEVARRVRAALRKSVLLVALTGYGQPEDTQRALRAGFDHHMTKPVAMEDLEGAPRPAGREPPGSPRLKPSAYPSRGGAVRGYNHDRC